MKTRLRLLFWSILTLAAGLAFLDNVSVVVKWWRAFAAVGGDSSRLPESVSGILPWFDFLAIDHSTVSTLIPFLGFTGVLRGLWRILRRKPCSPENFPYSASTDRLNVALGLVGTLWGIIVIGYFQLDKVSMGDLMRCLHTALFSTLVAVVWVFLIDHPIIRPWMRSLLAETKLALDEDTDLTSAVDALVARLLAASDAFDRRQRDFEAAALKRLEDLEADNKASRKRLEEDAAVMRARLEEENAKARTRFAEELAAISRDNKEERQRRREEVEELAAKVSAAREQVLEIEKSRQIAVAQAEAAETRAAQAIAKLEAVRGALRV